MNKPIIVSVVRDYAMYDKCIAKNPVVSGYRLEPVDNRERNEYITVCYNRTIEKFVDADTWLIFCHEDFQFLEDPALLLEKADKNSIYGPIGGVLEKKFHCLYGEHWKGSFVGLILESEKDGSGVGELGKMVPMDSVVETLDCQCVIVHSTLLKKYRLGFDERLSYDLYVEDFCINALVKGGVKTKIIPVKCQHYSHGTIAPRFFLQSDYLCRKYPKMEFFGAVGYYIGGGRTPLRRLQKKTRSFLDRHCPWLSKALQDLV